MEIKPVSMIDQLRMIQPQESISPKRSLGVPSGITPNGQPSFLEFLERKVAEVNNAGLEADRMIQKSLAGTEVNPHDTIIAIQQADISFRLLLTVKERLIQAYDTLIRTQMG